MIRGINTRSTLELDYLPQQSLSSFVDAFQKLTTCSEADLSFVVRKAQKMSHIAFLNWVLVETILRRSRPVFITVCQYCQYCQSDIFLHAHTSFANILISQFDLVGLVNLVDELRLHGCQYFDHICQYFDQPI